MRFKKSSPLARGWDRSQTQFENAGGNPPGRGHKILRLSFWKFQLRDNPYCCWRVVVLVVVAFVVFVVLVFSCCISWTGAGGAPVVVVLSVCFIFSRPCLYFVVVSVV
jgi:hypothetical protein